MLDLRRSAIRSGDFAVFIGHIDNDGSPYPFEVWVNGAEQPRGLGAIAKTLSMDMRTDDRAWLDMKLSALQKAGGDDGFEMAMPPDGRQGARAEPGVGLRAAGALSLQRARRVRRAKGRATTPVVDALMGPKEPKAGPDGTLSLDRRRASITRPATTSCCS